MTVRPATQADYARVVELGARFHAYSPHRVLPFDPVAFGCVAERLIADGGVFLSDTGFCGGIMTTLYFAPGVPVCTELFWYTEAEGRDLREALEGWARSRGAVMIQCSALVDEHEKAVDRLYRRSGYSRVETSYLKRL